MDTAASQVSLSYRLILEEGVAISYMYTYISVVKLIKAVMYMYMKVYSFKGGGGVWVDVYGNACTVHFFPPSVSASVSSAPATLLGRSGRWS